MKFILSILLSLFVTTVFSQEENKSFRGVTLTEEFTSSDYTLPDSLLFYSGGHWEIEKFYTILFKKLKKQFKKSSVITAFTFDNNDSIPALVKSFEEIEYRNSSDKNNVVCVFAIGNLESNLNRVSRETGQTVFINKKRVMYYNLFMMLIDKKTDSILMKRKFSVEANEVFYNNNKNLAKAIAEEIKI